MAMHDFLTGKASTEAYLLAAGLIIMYYVALRILLATKFTGADVYDADSRSWHKRREGKRYQRRKRGN